MEEFTFGADTDKWFDIEWDKVQYWTKVSDYHYQRYMRTVLLKNKC